LSGDKKLINSLPHSAKLKLQREREAKTGP